MNANSPTLYHHSVMMKIAGYGVMITGKAGIGKSTLALSLLAQGHQLIADDSVEYRRHQNQLIASCPTLLKGLLHTRELGLLDIRQLFGQDAWINESQVDAIVHLTDTETSSPSHDIASQSAETELLDVNIPTLSLSILSPCSIEVRLISWLKNRPLQQQTIETFKQAQQQMMQQ